MLLNAQISGILAATKKPNFRLRFAHYPSSGPILIGKAFFFHSLSVTKGGAQTANFAGFSPAFGEPKLPEIRGLTVKSFHGNFAFLPFCFYLLLIVQLPWDLE